MRSSRFCRPGRRLERDVELDAKLARDMSDLGALLDLAAEGEDVLAELNAEVARLEQEIHQTESRTLLSGEHDEAHAIVTIHPGAGGTESQDWAEMLLRMYLRWAERSGYATEILDYQQGEEAGIRSVTFLAKGDYAYGNLCAEIGVHRLVRISPFDAAARRHTSFASVFVYPEIDDKIDSPDRGKGPADRHLQILRRRRAACQRDGLRRSHHPHSHRHCGFVPERTVPDPQPRYGPQGAARPPL